MNEAFETYYSTLLRSLKVTSIEQGLFKVRPVLWFRNKMAGKVMSLWKKHELPRKYSVWSNQAYSWPETIPFGQTVPGVAESLLYPLNPASLLPIHLTNIKPGDKVLDACAAPGGKSLLLADLMDQTNSLIANDISPQRSKRMKITFRRFGQNQIIVCQHPVERIFVYYPNFFDVILADVPCSSEVHIWSSPKHLKKWSVERIEHLKKRQIQMVERLFKALKVGGRLIYNTCALNPEENEIVIETIIKKYKNKFRLDTKRVLPYPIESGMPGYTNNVDRFRLYRLYPHLHQAGPGFAAVLIKTNL